MSWLLTIIIAILAVGFGEALAFLRPGLAKFACFTLMLIFGTWGWARLLEIGGFF